MNYNTNRHHERKIMNEKMLEYIIMGLVSASGWIAAIGRSAFMSSIMEKVSQRFVSKEIYEKDMAIIRASLSTIESKVDGGMNKLEAKIDKLIE